MDMTQVKRFAMIPKKDVRVMGIVVVHLVDPAPPG